MAIEIPRNTVADHVVFDRIVDADRTIKIAREAAAAAAAAGKQDVADKLNEKADALEKILLATQQPDYEEDEEEPPVGSSGENSGSGNEPQNSGNDGADDQAGSEDDQDEQSGSGSGANSEQQDSGSDEEGKTPDDIANMDQSNGTHASGTQRIGGGGPSGGDSGGSGGGGGGQGSNNGAKNNSNKQKGGQQEIDPFRLRSGQGNGQQKQPTKEEILAAVIKRLNGLGGNAKAGADRALRKLFDELGGSGDIDD